MMNDISMEKLLSMKELTIDAKIENLHLVQEFISIELKASFIPKKTQTQIALVAEEVFVNIAHYAYNADDPQTVSEDNRFVSKEKTVAIRIAVDNEIVLEFEDNGTPFNPLETDDPEIMVDVDKREAGGFGIFIVKNIVDDIKYRYENNKNILQLIKKNEKTA